MSHKPFKLQLCIVATSLLLSPSLYADTSGEDGFHFTRAYLETSYITSHVSDTNNAYTGTTPIAGTVNNVGASQTNVTTTGISARYGARIRGGLTSSGLFNGGTSTNASNFIRNNFNGYAFAGFLEYSLFRPLNVGIVGGAGQSFGDISYGATSQNFTSVSSYEGIYATAFMPLAQQWLVRFTPSFVSTNVDSNYNGTDASPSNITANNQLNLFNLTPALTYSTPLHWQFDVGAVLHNVVTQTGPISMTRHSDYWTTPFLAVTYKAPMKFDIYGRASTEAGDRYFESETYSIGIAKRF